MDIVKIKKKLGEAAAHLVKDGMIVGLGTGSTAECFIESLIRRVELEKLNIQAVASSKRSAELAKAGKIILLDINDAPRIDLTIDGADEIDPQKRLIKGAGGALLREKILAANSSEMIVIADESKCVKQLGKTKLPVEIVPFGSAKTRQKIESLDWRGAWRTNEKSKELFVTDNGHFLLDLAFTKPLAEPERVQDELKAIPGVVDTGLFFHLAGRILIGGADGRIREY